MNKELVPRDESLLSCPFTRSCHLPKDKEVCGFPNYKLCPEYQLDLNKLKTASKVLH